jgi:hypothetical protein
MVSGGCSVDAYAYAYGNDPIVHGFILQSGNTLIGNPNDPTALSRWSKFSETAGCGPVSAEADMKNMACLQAKPVEDVMRASKAYGVLGIAGMWKPQSDERTVYSNYKTRTASGNFIKAVSTLMDALKTRLTVNSSLSSSETPIMNTQI